MIYATGLCNYLMNGECTECTQCVYDEEGMQDKYEENNKIEIACDPEDSGGIIKIVATID